MESENHGILLHGYKESLMSRNGKQFWRVSKDALKVILGSCDNEAKVTSKIPGCYKCQNHVLSPFENYMHALTGAGSRERQQGWRGWATVVVWMQLAPRGSGTISRCCFVGVGMALLEGVCHWGGGRLWASSRLSWVTWDCLKQYSRLPLIFHGVSEKWWDRTWAFNP